MASLTRQIHLMPFPRGAIGPAATMLSRRQKSSVAPFSHFDLAKIPSAKYGGRHTITMMPGEGIGPEMMGYVKEVYQVASVPVDFEMVQLNPTTDNYDDLYNAISSVRRNGCGIKGNIETKLTRPDIKSRNVEMRKELDLFVNVVHCRSIPAVTTRHDNIDVVLVRQNTEGEYAMLEHQNVPGVVESLKIVTAENTRRLVNYAFEYAQANDHRASIDG